MPKKIEAIRAQNINLTKQEEEKQNYLSSYLNKHLNTNFQVWLNTLRIEMMVQGHYGNDPLSV